MRGGGGGRGINGDNRNNFDEEQSKHVPFSLFSSRVAPLLKTFRLYPPIVCSHHTSASDSHFRSRNTLIHIFSLIRFSLNELFESVFNSKMGNLFSYPDSRIVETAYGKVQGRRLIYKGDKQVDAFQVGIFLAKYS